MNRRTDGAAVAESTGESKREILRRQSKKSVIINLIVLFGVVVFFIVLSYLMQNKTNSRMNTLYSENASAQQHIANLLAQNDTLTSQNDELIAKNGELAAENSTLNEEIAGLKTELDEARKLWAEDVDKATLAGDEKYNELLKEYEDLLSALETEENTDD